MIDGFLIVIVHIVGLFSTMRPPYWQEPYARMQASCLLARP